LANCKPGVDHNIMTAEQAGQELMDYATKLFNKAADDILQHVTDRSKSLIDYASIQTLAIEHQVFADVETIIDQFQCQTLGVKAIIDRQQNILDENANSWVKTIAFWSRSKTDEIQTTCRAKLFINAALKSTDMEIPTS
jgi:hypothetical protein